jgi:hypothetical protein
VPRAARSPTKGATSFKVTNPTAQVCSPSD